MVESSLVASIFDVAAVGTSVATTLYEAADVMINAHQQIFALARHVSQFTAVLKHMGQVLETERTNCSKEVFRDIRKIKHSCKRTFREITSTVKSKRFRHSVTVRWLFKRTKAMELEARLDSQQSMLQCIIHTLTVSKLGHIDARSKQDSAHITGLKVEIKLLKTFIMESYNNSTELRLAEQSMEVEAGYQPISGGSSHPGVHHPYRDGATFPPNPIGRSNTYEPPITRSPSPASSASKSENGDSNSDDETDDDNNSTESGDQNDQDSTGPEGNTSNTEGLVPRPSFQPRSSYNDASDDATHRESNLLLHILPYRPRLRNRICSDRLIRDRRDPDSDTKSATQEATNSVRLLLDKWTISGSAPVSNILDEEAAGDKKEAELADKRRTSEPQSDTYRLSLSPGAMSGEDNFGPTHYPGLYEYPPRFQDDHVPPPPPWEISRSQYDYPHYGTSVPRQKDYWRPSHPFPQPPGRQLGVDILAALRSTRGGIYYTKSNQFKEVHYVDEYPIYTCAFVPSHIVPYNERKPLNTELGRGLIRRKALDLLGYSYTETEAGKFLILSDLELREIEELVKLSYQALDRYSKERSKTVIMERGWSEAIDAMSRTPGTYPKKPSVAPQYPPPMPESWNQNEPPYGEYTGHRTYTEYDGFLPDKSAPSQTALPRLRDRKHPSARRRTRPVEFKSQEQESTKIARPEVRFTLPRAQLASSTVDTVKEAQPSPAKSYPSLIKTDDELTKACQRLEQLKIRKEEAEKAKNLQTVSDIEYFAIPDLELQILKLVNMQRVLKQYHKEMEEVGALVSQNKEDNGSHYTEKETESE